MRIAVIRCISVNKTNFPSGAHRIALSFQSILVILARMAADHLVLIMYTKSGASRNKKYTRTGHRSVAGIVYAFLPKGKNDADAAGQQ
jgi:hypothetical protein